LELSATVCQALLYLKQVLPFFRRPLLQSDLSLLDDWDKGKSLVVMTVIPNTFGGFAFQGCGKALQIED
jgi:hypothetical protein